MNPLPRLTLVAVFSSCACLRVSGFVPYFPPRIGIHNGFRPCTSAGTHPSISRRSVDRPSRASSADMSNSPQAIPSNVPAAPETGNNAKSIAVPFLPRPKALDGSMIGDVGFDPLGFATPDNLERYREAELKHGRLTMVALAGWPIASTILALLTGLVPPETVCTGNGCAIDQPFSGSALPLEVIGRVSFAYWGSALALSIAAELVSLRKHSDAEQLLRSGPDGYRAGDLGLDPFGWADDEMRLREIKHGRLAMAAFAFHYAGVLLEKKGVVVG